MTCQDFENVIHELVTGREAYARQADALEHAGRCLWCAMRLDEETNLSKALQGVREALGACQAPARVEEALVRTLREKTRQAASHNTVRLLLRPGLGWGAALGATVTAALLALLLAPHFLRHSYGPSPPAGQSRSLQSSAPSSAKAIQPFAVGQTRKEVMAQLGRHAAQTAPERKLGAETLDTEFIPLATCDDPECLDGAVVVRVALSSEALLMIGIPVGSDFASGPVLADLVLGSDGVPYGIRFVD